MTGAKKPRGFISVNLSRVKRVEQKGKLAIGSFVDASRVEKGITNSEISVQKGTNEWWGGKREGRIGERSLNCETCACVNSRRGWLVGGQKLRNWNHAIPNKHDYFYVL